MYLIAILVVIIWFLIGRLKKAFKTIRTLQARNFRIENELDVKDFEIENLTKLNKEGK